MKRMTLKTIKYLIEIDRLDIFYHSKEFKKIKKQVQKEFHFECLRCKENKRLTLVDEHDPVHHVKEVKQFPELALSKYYKDEQGRLQRNLIPLCFECHNIVHDRFNKISKFTNKERW